MPQSKFQSHLGMSDILPDEAPKWQRLEALIRDTARRFHFSEIRTPIMEPTELIARGIGQLTDIVSKEMFAFNRGEDQYVLRPEGTAPVARAFIEHHLEQRGGIQKLFYIGPMFRAERPQKGRQRQFHQFGVEIIGTDAPLADVESIAFLTQVVEAVGLKNLTLKINSVGDAESRKAYKDALVAYFTPEKNSLSEISQQRLQTNPMRILDSKEEEDQDLIAKAPLISSYLNEDCERHFAQVQDLLKDRNIDFHVDPRLVRGLDYYSKTAFELISDDIGSQSALGGGGRYDLLIEELGGAATPAVGMAAGMERILLTAEAQSVFQTDEEPLDVYFVSRGDQAQRWCHKVMDELRDMGLSATMDLGGRSMKAQMKEANRENARFTIIVGDSELESESFTFRDMKQSTEVSLSWAEIVKTLKVVQH